MILLLDFIGKGDKMVPSQIGATAENVGFIIGLTVIVNLTGFAHCPASGVKVCSVVETLFNAGDQEPVILLLDFIGKGDKIVPSQMGAMAVNVGLVFIIKEPLSVASGVHPPEVETVKLKVPDAVGVPLMVNKLPTKFPVTPDGKLPDTIDALVAPPPIVKTISEIGLEMHPFSNAEP